LPPGWLPVWPLDSWALVSELPLEAVDEVSVPPQEASPRAARAAADKTSVILLFIFVPFLTHYKQTGKAFLLEKIQKKAEISL
jgi:hypothetical protein